MKIRSFLSKILRNLIPLVFMSAVVLGACYVLLPKMENLNGQCFYFLDDDLVRGFKQQRRVLYGRVLREDFFRYHINYQYLHLAPLEDRVTALSFYRIGTRSHLFLFEAVVQFRCPKVGEIFKL